MQRSLSVLSVFAACCLATSVRAQSRTSYNAARLTSTANPAALGGPVGLSIGVASDGPTVVADIAVGRGALRLLGSRVHRSESYGLGYGASLIADSLWASIRWSLGAELNLGYHANHIVMRTLYVGTPTSLNALLSVPLALHIGSDRRLSMTPYVAPYAEIGEGPAGYWNPEGCSPAPGAGPPCTQFVYADHYTTHAVGTVLGVRLTAWRLALDVTYVEVADRFQRGLGTAAISVRF